MEGVESSLITDYTLKVSLPAPYVEGQKEDINKSINIGEINMVFNFLLNIFSIFFCFYLKQNGMVGGLTFPFMTFQHTSNPQPLFHSKLSPLF